jgi:hypothetical protein
MPPSTEARIVGALIGAAATLPMMIALRGFMVDDGLISARYAANLAAGAGYVFNAGATPTDGVTPLGWAHLLAPFARGERPVLMAFAVAKWIGAVAWMVGGAAIGWAIASMPRIGTHARWRWAALLMLIASAPLGAWAVSGMETGVVMALGAVAAAARCLERERTGLIAAGLAAAWRPELIPWALAFAVISSRDSIHGALRFRTARAAIVASPAILVAIARLIAFGRAAPLSLRAKAPDVALGSRYAAACFLLTGVIAAIAWKRMPAWARGLQTALLAHHGAMALAGGDWMPLSRLAVPVLPSAILVASCALTTAHAAVAWPRLALALAGEIFACARAGPAAARVGSKRMAVIEQLRPWIENAKSVACVDAGWTGALTRGKVVDLAGVTDPAIAVLPGGHTSKRIPSALFDARAVDTLVLLLAPTKPVSPRWSDSHFARYTELFVAHLPQIDRTFCVAAESGDPHYLVLKRCIDETERR